MSRIAATVLVALGEFGSSVASLLKTRVRTGSGERSADLAIIDVPIPSNLKKNGESQEKWLAEVEEFLSKEVSKQLALSSLIERAPAESSLPWLDVIIVGDLDDGSSRAALLPLIETTEHIAATGFPTILGRDASRLVVLPLLAIGETRGEVPTDVPRLDPDTSQSDLTHRSRRGERPKSTTKSVIQALGKRTCPKTRTFLFEAHTPKYILSREEVVSTAVGMVELLVLAGLRDSDQIASFLHEELPRTPGSSPEPAQFGTFGVASVRVDADLIGSYCRNRASLAIVESMRAGLDLGLSEREDMARELRLLWDDVRDRLGLAAKSSAALEQVEKIVQEEAPTFSCPEIDWRDSPEDIKERKFGDDWYRSVGGSIDHLIDRLERRRMHELAAKIDASGLTIARKRRQRVRESVDSWIWERPQGWSAARSTLCLLRDEAATEESEASYRITSRSLPPMPTPEQLHAPVIAVRQEAERRPRPFRLWLTGLLLAIPAILFGYQLLALLEYPLEAWNAPEWLLAAVTPPWSLALTSVIMITTIALTLRSIIQRHHREISEVRDELRRSIQRLITGREGSVLAYYLARLELARELWVFRLARLDRKLLEEELERLDEIQRGLDTLRDQIRASQRQLGVRYANDTSTEEDLTDIKPRGDLILRDAADGPLLTSTYDHVTHDEEELTRRFFERLSSAHPVWRGELPMADRRRMRAFLAEALELPRPGELLLRDDLEKQATVKKAIKRVLTELTTRLSPSLGLTEDAIRGNSSWIITAPKGASHIVDEALETLRDELELEAFGSEWLRLTSPRDDGRIYLSALVTHLPWTAIGAFSR